MSRSLAGPDAARVAHRPEILVNRVFDVPRALVFEAWSTPQHLSRWWGPAGFSLPFCELDLRRGGAFNLVMRGPDGREYPMDGVIHEVVRPERIVFSAVIDRATKDEVLTIVTFAEEAGKTRLTVRQTVPQDPASARGQATGWSESLGRLEAMLAADVGTADETDPGTGSGRADREIVATRLYDAPCALVWKAWTEPEHVGHWWGPNGFRTTIHEMNVRPGGVWRFVLHGPDGMDYRNECVFAAVREPSRLVWDHVSGPRFHATVRFEEVAGGTKVTMRMRFDTAAERSHVAEKFGAVEGQKQTLDRLDAYLAELVARG
jgi:uncharacterized protein YndB with AHSA1/START domain